jgi:hypothetical protein
VVKQCPAFLIGSQGIMKMVSYFYFWKNYGQYPDNSGRIYQSEKLVRAFDFMNHLCGEYDRIEYERQRNK